MIFSLFMGIKIIFLKKTNYIIKKVFKLPPAFEASGILRREETEKRVDIPNYAGESINPGIIYFKSMNYIDFFLFGFVKLRKSLYNSYFQEKYSRINIPSII
ncbi:hypothetical protein DMUE_2648 [Dictyocoela muelleri]|nr:hypothetical protein DMUE_2648 [Dictyocoela muelleri]